MHSLLSRVLEQRQLNSAGQLFAINDYDVITDLHTAFQCIKNIFNSCEYVDNRIDQSVVEIVIARITAAIRETGSIETYSAELVDVLDICLQHKMTMLDDNGKYVDSPHCKIANDLLSSLFLHYSKRTVMTLTLPVAIKALGCSNQDLVRNVTSYISLAAIHNGKTLSNYAIDIISHVIKGNYSLLRVLPQIYSDNREAFHAHLGPLMSVLDENLADCSEKLSLLQLASLLANYKPELLIPYLPQFEKFLRSPATCTAVLNIFMSLVSQGKADLLANSLPSLRKISADPEFVSSLGTIIKIIGNIGRVSLPLASQCVDDLMSCAKPDAQLHPMILSEIEGIGALYPSCLRPHLDSLKEFSNSTTNRTIERIISLIGVSSQASQSNVDVTVIRVPDKNSCDSLLSKTSLRYNGNDIITSGSRTVFPVSDSAADCSTQELDRNTHSLAMQYQNRSSGSLSKNQSRSHASVAGGYRSTSENVTMSGSRDLSVSGSVAGGSSRVPADYVTRPPPQYQPPKSQTMPSGSSSSSSGYFAGTQQIQIGKDGRVRPVPAGGRRTAAQCYETTFPAHSGPVTTTKMMPLAEEDDNRECWENAAPSTTTTAPIGLTLDRSDVVQQFVDHRRNKIRRYIQEISSRFPIPIQCTVEGSKSSKHRMIVHFACQARADYCVFNEDYLFNFKTKLPASWLHLMFLQMQSTSIDATGHVIPQSSPAYLKLSHCWQCLPSSVTKGRPFVTLVTSAFPSSKDQDRLLKELEQASFYDCFSLDGPSNRWQCFSCSNPDKVKSFVEDGGSAKVLEGQLKEKRGRWRFVRRWHTKYFTLSSAALTTSSIKNANNNWSNTNNNAVSLPAIDLKNIRSVRSLSRGRKNRKSLRRAFEIFTADNTTVVLKATDEKKAEEWLQCLQIAVAHARREN